MIYYTNANLHTPHIAFIGRWSPFHQGHVIMVNKKRAEHPHLPILIMVRDTPTEAYTASMRAEYIKIWMVENHIQGTIMIIPNVEGVYWGRGVGYHVGQIDVDIETKRISATAIRNDIENKSSQWHKDVASEKASYVLSPSISKIISRGLVIWLTGCPSSGKTTIARALAHELHERYPYIKTQLLDGDDMRISPLAMNVGFSQEDRANHIRRMGYLANMFANHGVVVICAFVSPDRAIREEAKKMIGKNRFLEVYVLASQKTRIRRDTKGLYKKATNGLISNLTGYNATYEKPLRPAIVCNTDRRSVSLCIRAIMTRLFPRQHVSSLTK